MLVHINDPYPKPSPRERWFQVAKWYLVFWGVFGTAVSIIGGVLLVALLIIPCYVIYLILPGPKMPEFRNYSHQPSLSKTTNKAYSHQGSKETHRYDDDDSYGDSDTSIDEPYSRRTWDDEKKNDTKKGNYIPDISDGWLFKRGTYIEEEDDDD